MDKKSWDEIETPNKHYPSCPTKLEYQLSPSEPLLQMENCRCYELDYPQEYWFSVFTQKIRDTEKQLLTCYHVEDLPFYGQGVIKGLEIAIQVNTPNPTITTDNICLHVMPQSIVESSTNTGLESTPKPDLDPIYPQDL